VDDFYRVVAVAGAALVAAGALWTVVRLQRERPFSSLGTLIAGAGAALSLVIYILIVDIDLKEEATWGLLAGGAAAGAFIGTKIPLYQRGDTVLSRAAGWHLALPAAAIAAFQVMGVRESVDGIILGFAALHAATAFAVAASALLLVRRLVARPARSPAEGRAAPILTAAAPRGQCPRCGSPVRPNWRHCMACGVSL
jgi:hypothetical protein